MSYLTFRLTSLFIRWPRCRRKYNLFTLICAKSWRHLCCSRSKNFKDFVSFLPQTDYKTVRSVKTVRMSCFVVIKMKTYISQFLTTLDRLFVLRLITKICPHKKYCSKKTPKHTQNSSLLRNRMQMKISISETGIATWYLWSLHRRLFSMTIWSQVILV